jgi:signal transduction histidine kinase
MNQDKKDNMTDRTVEDNRLRLPKKVKLNFPWLSLVASLILILLFIYLHNPILQAYYQIELPALIAQELLIVVLILGCIYWFDIRLFLKRKFLLSCHIMQLEQQIKDIWRSKNEQQQRANTYSGRTDKLKSFISDKLLDSIEFDEKFLHFKGIASEVRHNGVISFDKVMTALNVAIQQQSFLAIYEQQVQQEEQVEENGPHSVQAINSLANYQSAIDAMRYLWVLLDLSTADNMSLHIGNQLIECEEHYYQLQLDSENNLDSTQSIPSDPTFYPQQAVLMTLSLLCDEPEIRDLISLAKINRSVLKDDFEFNNELFCVQLKATQSILGNPNHIVLLLENLIKNALFFHTKSHYKQATDRIGIYLNQQNKTIHLKVYNRGPQIDNNKDKIFKLGFTTRKNKQHHGKGLGLFFVSEIVKGYQGHLEVNNIKNESCTYQLSIFLEDNTIEKHQIQTHSVDGRMKVRLVHDDTEVSDVGEGTLEETKGWLNDIKLETKIAAISLQLSRNEKQHEMVINQMTIVSKNQLWLEPNTIAMPKWRIQVKSKKRQHLINFKALDIAGVCFEISLPIADNSI